MKQDKIIQGIEEFCSYFERQLNVITQLDVDLESIEGVTAEDYQVWFYRKALIAIGIDTLSGIRFSKSFFKDLHDRNRDRFIRFIAEVAKWPEGELVSVPFLQERLIEAGLQNRPLSRHIEKNLSNFEISAGVHIGITQVDVPANQLLPSVTSQKEDTFISDLKHYSLLYRYRNHLVHESRQPGALAWEMDSLSKEPYYHGYPDDTKWYLVYPMQVFTDLFKASIRGIKSYLMKNNIDPYDLVKRLNRW